MRRGTRMARAVAALSVAGALSAGLSGVASAHPLKQKGAGGASSSSGNLIDHGGQITPASHTYAIFWGPPSAWSTDVAPGIGSFFSGLNGSSFLGIAQQYMRGASVSSTYAGVSYDTSAPPKRVSANTLANEVVKLGLPLDNSNIYFVYTSNFPNGGGFCAWHSYATVSGQNLAVAYMPNTTGVAGCDPGNLYGVSGSEGLRSLVNVTSHEFMEAITDTWPSSQNYGWIDGSGSEIGDKCAWQFNGAVTLANKTHWQLQQEWSNAISGCQQQ